MIKRNILLLTILSQTLFAAAADETELVQLKSIQLASSNMGKADDYTDSIFIDRNLNIPGRRKELINQLERYIGQPLSEADIDDIKATVTRFYEKNNFPIVMVIVPPQDITSGDIKLIILEGSVGTIQFRGNKWTSDAYLKKNIRLKENDPINAYKLKRNVAWLNKNPFRSSDVVFYPGKEQGKTDVTVVTKERFPLQPYVGMDNTGTAFTERTRLYGGFNAGRLWGLDHRLSYQFTTALNWQSLSAHSGSYTMPLPWRHQFFAYGGWSRGRGDLHKAMKNEAVAWQASGRYQIPIRPIFGNFLQEFAFGYDFKKTNNSLLFGGKRVSKTHADTNQFMASYMLDYHARHAKTSFLLEGYASPFIMTEHQSKKYYNRIRPYAKPKYAYARARVSETYVFPHDVAFKWSFAGQYTAWNLLPSEMFGLGGYDTVRGYDERAVNVDKAILSSIEITAPTLHMINKNDKLLFLAFFDYGAGSVKRPTSVQKKTHWLAGTGFGFRYSLRTNLNVRCDLGFPLHRTGYGLHKPHLHVGGTLSY